MRVRDSVCVPRCVSPVCGAGLWGLPVLGVSPVAADARPSPGVCPPVFVASQIPVCVPVVAARYNVCPR